ncbi:MAG: hypothetical protein M3343_09075 [Actinomycetota bacterium]|nr:hypothetical protein [Actinomycetota bacterium]
MRKRARWLIVAACIAALGIQGLPAASQVPPDESSDNITQLSRTPADTTATQSDMAFYTDGGTEYTLTATYDGFRIIDTTNAATPVVVESFKCNGPQSDLSVMQGDNGNWYLFQSIDTPQTSEECASLNTNYQTHPNAFEGIRIFDITDPAAPVHINSVATDCGSHTHSLLPGDQNFKSDDENIAYLYISSYPLSAGGITTTPTSYGTECTKPHKKISIVRVDLTDPASDTNIQVVERALDFFTKPFDPGNGPFVGCHDIAFALGVNQGKAFNEGGDWAAGACFEEGQLWDVTDPMNPSFTNRWRNDNRTTIDLYHSAAFTWDGKMVIFGDEAGGGGGNRCRWTDDEQGRFWFHEFKSLRPVGSYKIPRPQAGNCTAHILNVIPTTNNRYLFGSSWYDGGTSVVDFTNPTNAKEIAFYDAGDPRANVWATYWYNGHFFANDIGRGLEIYDVDYGPLSKAIDFPEGAMNPQTQFGLFDDSKGCTIFGTAGHDVLKGTPGDDVICGFGGSDEIDGRGGNDILLGGAGHDFILGGGGRDVIRGGVGHDFLKGESGNDRLLGGEGNDFLNGGGGTDVCKGGPGKNAKKKCEN